MTAPRSTARCRPPSAIRRWAASDWGPSSPPPSRYTSPSAGSVWSERTSTHSTGSPRRSARLARINRLPRSPYVDSRTGYTHTSRSWDSVATVKLRSDVLEGRVVRDDLKPSRWRLGERLHERRHLGEGDIVDLKPDREVQRPVAGDQHVTPAQRREVDVVEPGGVQAVRVARVDRQESGRVLGHVERLQPAGRVLGQQE